MLVLVPLLRKVDLQSVSYPLSGELASLTSLTMEEIDIDGVDKWAKSAGSLTRLTALSLSECELLTNETLKALAALSSLSLLSLRNCDLVSPSTALRTDAALSDIQHQSTYHS